MEDNTDYATFLRRLAQMDTLEILLAGAEAKTGSRQPLSHLSIEVEAMAAGAPKAYISALEAHNANKLIDDSLK